jgi:hypothetical protein
VDVHGITPAAAGIENDRQPAHGANIDRDFGHLGQGDVGFGHALEPAERAAAHVDRLEPRILGNPRHDRIERTGSDDQLIASDKFAEIRQNGLHCFAVAGRTMLFCAIARDCIVIPGHAGAGR